MRASKIGLLALILAFGAGVEIAWQARHRIGFGPFGIRVLGGRFYGPSHAFDSETRREVAPATRVRVTNAFGRVDVRAGDAGAVVVRLRTVVYLPDEDDARDLAGRVRIVAELDGSRLGVGTNRSDAAASARGREVGFETHLDVTVPPDTPVEVENEHGRIDVADVGEAAVTGAFESIRLERVAGGARVSGRHGDVRVAAVEGDLDLTAAHGSVEVADVRGDARIETRHARLVVVRAGAVRIRSQFGAVDVSDVRGDVEVQGAHSSVAGRDVGAGCRISTSHGGIRAEGIAGEARLKTEHGSIHASRVSGPVFVETSFDDVELEQVTGTAEVKVRHGGVVARGLEGGADVHASGEDVVLDDFAGPVTVEVLRGSLRLAPGRPLLTPVTARASHGGITLSVPPGSQFDLETESEHGNVVLDLPGLQLSLSERGRARGVLGAGGNPVSLHARLGEIRVESDASASDRASSPLPRAARFQ